MTVSRVVMMGTGTFAEPTLEALLTRPGLVVGVVTQPDRAGGAVRGSTRQVGKGMKAIAEAAGVPVFQPESINTPEGVALLRDLQPDLLVVAAYGQILSRDVLGVPPLGGINVHGSLLPKYRGAAPVAWAILRGETRTGVTIIRMTTGLDAGDMLAQEAIDIGPEETAGEVEARLAPLGARLALEVIDRLRQGPVVGVKQELSLVTKAPKLKKEQGLIDWSQSADQVCRQIRAMQPWPTAYAFLHELPTPAETAPLRVQILRATPEPLPEEHANAMRPRWEAVFEQLGIDPRPGGVDITARPAPILPRGSAFNVKGEAISVLVGDGSVRIHELQPAGKRRMTAAEFLRGHSLKLFSRFGPEVLS
jgi:methionyl-tRNA formyltransferase